MATITKYESWNLKALNGEPIDWDTDTIKVMLVTNTYVPNADTHVYKSDITNEVSGSNYTAGGVTLTTPSVSEASGTTTVDFDDATWLQHATGFSNARYAIIYKDTGVAATSVLMGYINMTSDRGNVNGDLTLQWAGTGVFTQA